MERCAALILLSCLAFAVAAEAFVSRGEWKPMNDVKDAHLLHIGRFAVHEHNKQANADPGIAFLDRNLRFSHVVRGERQVNISHITYRLVLEVTNMKGERVRDYEAVVEENAHKKIKTLVSFKLLYGVV